MFPLTAAELGKDFDLPHAVRFGGLPSVWVEKDPADFLASYVRTYLQEEVQQEGVTRNLAGFTRFLEAASFSQTSVLNIAGVARDCGVERKTVEQWFQALEDLLLAVRLPMFRRRAKRAITAHPRFFLFDAGVYRTLRPRGPLDAAAEIDGPALEARDADPVRVQHVDVEVDRTAVAAAVVAREQRRETRRGLRQRRRRGEQQGKGEDAESMETHGGPILPKRDKGRKRAATLRHDTPRFVHEHDCSIM
jgi:hypothetical protein